MAKKPKQEKTGTTKGTASQTKHLNKSTEKNRDYFYAMSAAPRIDENIHGFQLAVLSFFTSFVIMIVHMANYKRPMDQFYWTNAGNDLVDFFSYYKMVAILTCAIIVLIILAYRLFSQTFAIKRSVVYIPMIIYSVMVLISYFASDYKVFAWLGWNDRFEGTAVLLSYMLLLFYVINSINTEKAVKWVLYPLGVSSAILGLLGLSQALNKDFFRTSIGQKLIVSNTITADGSKVWDLIDQAIAAGKPYLDFTFKHQEIYQTVYNINYVSFYLTLLIPIFGLLFIYAVIKGKEEKLSIKIMWGALFALLLYNLIGSASSGGYFGMAVVVLLALLLLNKKILNWWKPLSALIIIALLIGGITYERWLPEVSNTFKVMHTETATAETEKQGTTTQGHLDFLKTEGNNILLSYNNQAVTFVTNPEKPMALHCTDAKGNEITLQPQLANSSYSSYQFDNPQLKDITVHFAQDKNNNVYTTLNISGLDWYFMPTDDGVKYISGLGKITTIAQAPAIGWKDNQGFGSGRGYIWSRTIPMMKSTVLIGHGADTYCIYFPQNDYVGKYNSGTFTTVRDIIVDKPHNMYMGMWIGTGGISVFAFLALMILYALQSIQVFWRSKFEHFIDFAGVGIFLGIIGFAVTGFVDDSSVSVMPMFYGLLGTGIAINIMLRKSSLKQPSEA